MHIENMNLKCRNQSYLRQALGSFLQDIAPVAIQSYYTNHKGAAFTLGLITVMRIKSHFAAAFQDFFGGIFSPPCCFICMHIRRPLSGRQRFNSSNNDNDIISAIMNDITMVPDLDLLCIKICFEEKHMFRGNQLRRT